MAKPKKKEVSKQIADEYDVFAEPLIKKKARPLQQQTESTDQIKKTNDQLNHIKCVIPKLNVQHLFHDILYEASKSPLTMKALKLILSQGYRELQEKKKYFTYKWAQLQNLNCSRSEYQRQEKELRAQQTRDTSDVHQQVIQALSENKIQGFKSKDEMLLEFRQNFMEQRLKSQQGPTVEEYQFYVDQQEANQLKTDQTTLLERLLQENQLTELSGIGDRGGLFPQRLTMSRQRIDSTQKEDHKFENEPQQAFTLSDKLNVPKLVNERLRNINSQRIEEILKLEPTEFQVLKRNVRVMLLDSKSDELYTDREFQTKQNDKYISLFQELKNDLTSDYRKMSEQQLEQCLEITTYLVNNAHYQQKYKQPASQLQPKDVITLLDKIYKPY